MHFTTLQKEASSFDRVTMDPSLSCIWLEIQFRPQRKKKRCNFIFSDKGFVRFEFETVFVMMFYDKRTIVARLQSLRQRSHNSQQTTYVLINIKIVTRYCTMQMSIRVQNALINLTKTAKWVSNNLII